MRQRISQSMQIVGPIQFWRGCLIYLQIYLFIFLPPQKKNKKNKNKMWSQIFARIFSLKGRKTRRGISTNRQNPTIQKIFVTLEPVMPFGCPSRLRTYSIFLTESILWLKAPSSTMRAWRRCKDIFTMDEWLNELRNDEGVYREARVC